jgi:hypothetical protein
MPNSYSFDIFYNKKTLKNHKEYGISYTTTPMSSYKKRLEIASNNINSKIIQIDGPGEKLLLPDKNLKYTTNITPFFSAGSSSGNWKMFLEDYKNNLKKLPKPGISLSEYFSKLNSEQKALCTTLYPAAAALRRSGNKNTNGAIILKDAINWTLKQIEKYQS